MATLLALSTTAALGVAAAGSAVMAGPAHAATVLTCNITTTVSQPSDPDGSTEGLDSTHTKQVTYQITSTLDNCVGDPAVTHATGTGTITFGGTCVSALGPGNVNVTWFDANNKPVGTTDVKASYEFVTTSNQGNPVTALVGIATNVTGRYASSIANAPRTAVDGTALNCLGPNPQPIQSSKTQGQVTFTGI